MGLEGQYRFVDRMLDPPSYGFTRDGKLYVPSKREIMDEFFSRLNLFQSRKNWLSVFSWIVSLSFAIPLYFFFTRYFSWPLFIAGFVYSMVCLGSHGTFWLHRYCTHRAYRFKNSFARLICRNLVIKIIPEEVYVISHHVHHEHSEAPGDPYNVHAGWLYCFLADVNHQAIRRDMTEAEYSRLCRLMDHTGVRLNSYAQYLKWGSLCHPAFAIAHYLLNWIVWFGIFYALGGMSLAVALFGWAGVWAIGIRTYNYDGHGGGKDKRQVGIDFNDKDLSINQMWPGMVAGEWHNNHHLYPGSARSGFMSYQLDIPWIGIWILRKIGAVSSYRDCKALFVEHYLKPFQAAAQARQASGGGIHDSGLGLQKKSPVMHVPMK